MSMSSRTEHSAFLLFASLLALALVAAFASAAPPAVKAPAAPAKTATAHVRRLTTRDSLAARAKISEATAQATALASVPGGRVKAHELEIEKGVLIYSFDIAVAGRPGIEEVNVNALDGSIVATQHEDRAAERLEAQQDRAEKAATRAARKAAKSGSAARDSARAR
jgi:uncharacterized membrane protein YkoI